MGIDLGRFKSKNNDEWLDWLSDDPVPKSLRERMHLGAPKTPEQPARTVVRRPGYTPRPVVSSVRPHVTQTQRPQESGVKTLNIRIAIPEFNFKKFKLPAALSTKQLPKLPKNLTYKQVGIGSGVLVLVLAVGVIAVNSKSHKGGKNGSTGVLSASTQKPDFAYNLPSGAGHSVDPSSVRYDATRKVVNYQDSIGGVSITISQQPLPDSFKSDPQGETKKVADGFNATKEIATANPTAFIGTSVNSGVQTVIFTKKGMLVFIQSSGQIDDHDWAMYITNLQ